MSYQNATFEHPIRASTVVRGSASMATSGNPQLINTTVPYNCRFAIIHANVVSDRSGETVQSVGAGWAVLDLETATLHYMYGSVDWLSGSSGQGTATSGGIAAGDAGNIIAGTNCYRVRISNYGGGRLKSLQIYGDDPTSGMASAVLSVMVEFVNKA